MNIKQIKEDIYMLSLSIEKMHFESMWETPHGVTLNSYIVKGEKTAIIDGFIGWDGVPETLYKALKEVEINPQDIDYLVVNHVEPDHSGWIENFKAIKEDFKVLVTQKGADLIHAFYGDDVNVDVVKEGDTLDLGAGKVLSFHPAPNVHWPDTMLTLEKSTGSLFSCDLFGAFGAMDEHVFDDEMTSEEKVLFEHEGARYFSNVMVTFSNMVEKAIIKTENLDVKMIAPGHGPIYRSNPQTIIDDYKRYCQYAKGYGKNEVTLLWGSMYGMTEKAVKRVKSALEDKGIKVNDLQVPYTEETDVVTKVFEAAAIILACPTYEYKMFPPMAHAIDEFGRKRITGKNAFRFGSFGWSGGAEKEMAQLFETHRMKWQFVESVEFKGMPGEDDFNGVMAGVDTLLTNMKEFIID